jgi:hypothetical protein
MVIHHLRIICFKLLFFIALLPCLKLYAGNGGKNDSVRVFKHTVSFGFGLVTENNQFLDDLFSKGTFGDLFYLSHFNYGDFVTTGALNLNYTLNLSKRFSIGCFSSFQLDSRSVFENSTGEKTGDARQIYSSLTPRIYFFWLNKDVFRIYSGCGTGVGYYWTKYRFGDTKFSGRKFEWKPQLTLVGVQAGRRFFGFGEANIGGRLGYLNLGVGYRFGNSKKYKQ